MTYTSTNLSAFYLDVTKDSLYSDPMGSQRRRGIQTVMYYVSIQFPLAYTNPVRND